MAVFYNSQDIGKRSRPREAGHSIISLYRSSHTTPPGISISSRAALCHCEARRSIMAHDIGWRSSLPFGASKGYDWYIQSRRNAALRPHKSNRPRGPLDAVRSGFSTHVCGRVNMYGMVPYHTAQYTIPYTTRFSHVIDTRQDTGMYHLHTYVGSLQYHTVAAVPDKTSCIRLHSEKNLYTYIRYGGGYGSLTCGSFYTPYHCVH